MLAVHFGAGNIGRGFIGSLLSQSGYEVIFVDVNAEIVQQLRNKREYRVVIAGESSEEQLIRYVSALHSQTQYEEVVDKIAKADLITTAVGPNELPHIANVIEEGLRKRLTVNQKRVHVIACENMIGGSSLLKKHVMEHLSEEESAALEAYCGFLNSAVDRIVPNQKKDDPLMVVVEPFFEWVIETKEVVGDIPPIAGAHFVKDLQPYIERKFFTVNTGHALAAYLGYYKKYATINEAMEDVAVRADVTKALHESGRVLVQKYGWNAEEHGAYIEKIVHRFINPAITDEVTRVARSPIRKLGMNDRLVSPASQYYNLFEEIPQGLVKGIAALLLFNYNEDAEAVELQKTISEHGIEGALAQYAQLLADHPLALAIKEQVDVLKR